MTDTQLVDSIRAHYDRLATVYRLFWGEHIHHGYWEADEAPAVAQERLVARLAERAQIPRGARVLDVGCGFGASSRWLARNLGCNVTGVTLSPVQAERGEEQARAAGLGERVCFAVTDANRLDLPAASFDAIWVIECSEHLFDKAKFIDNCSRILRPGGRLALCAWLAADNGRPEPARLVAEVCRGMLCPSLGTMDEYLAWMRAAGLSEVTGEDITRRVERTWAHCAAMVRRPEIRALGWLMDGETRAFVEAIPAIQKAYAEGAMSYGMFTARKP